VRVQVRFRFNSNTGEVEMFDIDDLDSRLPRDEHNREHDRIATQIGGVLERHPHLQELAGGSHAAAEPAVEDASSEATTRLRQTGRD
jgi:hypothetical protein